MSNLSKNEIEDLKEKLDLIKELLSDSERKVYENGFYYILFGISAIIFTFFVYLLNKLNLGKYVLYLTLIFISIIFVIIFLYNKRKYYDNKEIKNSHNIFYNFIGYLWLFNSINFILIFLFSILIFNKFYFRFYFAILSVYLGVNFILSSFLIQNGRVIKIPGILWIIVSFTFYFLKENIYLPLYFCIFVFFFEVIPGFYLYINYKKMKYEK